MATHSSVLAWRIPGMEEPGGLPSMGLQRVRHDWSDIAAAAAAFPPGHLYLPPPSSLLHVTVYLSRCPSLWRNFSWLTLDVLSSMLYRWRSLEATLKIKLKTRSRRLNSKSWEHQRTTDSREHELIGAHKTLHTYTETKHHPRANKFQSKTYHANTPATQEHTLELQYTGSLKLLQNHWHLITHYWTLHCTPERRNSAPATRTPTQASLTRKPWQATRPTPSEGGISTIKRNDKLPEYRKATPNTAV